MYLFFVLDSIGQGETTVTFVPLCVHLTVVVETRIGDKSSIDNFEEMKNEFAFLGADLSLTEQ